jgi:hypothetical protein
MLQNENRMLNEHEGHYEVEVFEVISRYSDWFLFITQVIYLARCTPI